jgi:hypothetical protein
MIPINNTLQLVVHYVAAHPGCKHSTVTRQASDRDGQQRRRDALSLAVCQGLIVKSPKRPFTYRAKVHSNA